MVQQSFGHFGTGNMLHAVLKITALNANNSMLPHNDRKCDL